MNQHALPYLRLSVPFVAGLALGGCYDAPIPYLAEFVAASACGCSALALRSSDYRYRWIFGAGLHFLLLVFGYYHIVAHNELRQAQHFSKDVAHNRFYVGVVDKAPSNGAKRKVMLKIEASGSSLDSMSTKTGNLLLFLEHTPLADSIGYGDRLVFCAKALPTTGAKNPDAFDYKRYLHFQNIHHQAFVKQDSIWRISSGHGKLHWMAAYACRERLLALLQKHFPSANEYAVASALLVGYTDDLSDDLRKAYADTGSMHALAVSGTHIGMLYVGLMFLLGRLRLPGRRGKLIEVATLLSCIWAFTLLTGATASVLRASLMFSIYLLGKGFLRSVNTWNVLAASAFFLLLFNPYFLFDVGFQLSYAAVGGMIFFYPRLYRAFPPMSRWSDEMLKVLLVGVAAQLGTIPLTLYYFHQFSVYFWLSGWIVVFAGAVFMWGGALLIALDVLSTTLAEILGAALFQMVCWMNQLIFLVQSLPCGVISEVWIAAWVVPMLYGCLVCWGAAIATRQGKWFGAGVGILLVLGMYRMMSVTGKQEQRTMVVYHVNKGRLVDFFDGNQLFTLSDSLSKKQEDFAAAANRTTLGSRGKMLEYFSDSLAFDKNNLIVDFPFAQFFEKRIAFIDDEKWIQCQTPANIDLDILVLSNSPRVTISACRRQFPHKMLVFDASNTETQLKRWRTECDAAGWAYHDVRSMGAWMSRQ